MSRRISSLAIVALMISACGSGEVVGPPEDAGDALIQISSEGGFAPVDFNIASGPTFTVTRDGTLVFPGVITLEYPGTLVLPVRQAELTPEQYNRILELIDEIGLADMTDETDDTVTNVADATTEIITYWDENGTHRYSVYALGISDQPQSQATAAFEELFDYLHQMTATLSGEPYQAELIRVVATPSYASQDPNFIDVRPWPLPGEDPGQWESLTTIGDQSWTCKTFDPSVLDSFADATQATLWMDPTESGDAQNIQLLVRPLHPGEDNCSLN